MKKAIIASIGLLAACGLAFSLAAHAAIVFDSSSSVAAENVGFVTSSIMIGSGSNEILMIGVAGNCGSPALVSASVSGATVTKLIPGQFAGRPADVFYATGVPPGLANVSSSCTTGNNTFAMTVSSFFNVNQASPIDATSTASSTIVVPVSTTIVTATQNDMLWDLVSAHVTSTGAGSGQTVISTPTAANNIQAYSSYKPVTATGTYTMSWTQSAAASWGQAIVALVSATSTVSASHEIVFGGSCRISASVRFE